MDEPPAHPDVSLVMPVWKPQPEWLRAAVASALASGTSLELIVVDDGGDDSVDAALAGLNDARARILHVPHGGESAARNAGVDAARGRFIRFVDADDLYVAGGTDRMLALAGDRTIVHASTMVCDEHMVPDHEIRSDLEGDVARATLLGRLEVMHFSMLFPAEVVRAAGPWDSQITISQDSDFVQRCVELAPVRALPDVVTMYRRHGAQATRSPTSFERARAGQRRILAKYADRHPEDRATQRAAWIGHHTRWARHALAAGRVRAFLDETLRLTARSPRAALPVWRSAAGRVLRRARPSRVS